MSYEIPGFKYTRLSDADFSTKKYYFVKAAASDKCSIAGDGEISIGVLQSNPSATDLECELVADGISFVEAGAAVAEGANVASNASGKAITAVAGKYILGVALKAAGADGDIIPVLLFNAGKA